MRLLRKATSLLKRCELSQRFSEANIGRFQQQMDEVDNSMTSLDAQADVLRTMLRQQQQPGVTNLAGLFAVQQRNAVCRQKLQALGLERVTLQEQREFLSERQQEECEIRQQWQKKGNKLQHCLRSKRRQIRLSQSLRDESEIQEQCSWHK